jgi:uncharacterized protein (UPF0335 family)
MVKMTPQTEGKDESQNSQPTQESSLDAILDRLNKLETENKELKDQVNPENAFTKGKKRYE